MTIARSGVSCSWSSGWAATPRRPSAARRAATSAEHQAEVVTRIEALGGRRVDIGQCEATWVVMADPEGNELCVLSPRD